MTATVVSSGQTSSGIVLNFGDTETVLSGGTASATTINDGGVETVSVGGLDVGASINSDGVQFVYGTASAVLINVGGLQLVFGETTGTTISNGGSAIIESGGTANGTIISKGGGQTVLSGGTDSGAIIGGSETVSSGGTAVAATLLSGGRLEVLVGGSYTGLTWSAGTLAVGLPVSGQTLTSGQILVLLSGGAGSGITIESGGAETVESGAIDRNAVVHGGALQVINAGGVASGATLGGGVSSAFANQNVSGLASGTVVNPNAAQVVVSGGVAIGTVLNPSSNSAVRQVVGSSSTASGTIVNSGACQEVNGGTAIGTVVSSGGLIIISSGTASGALLSGVELTYGTDSGATIADGGVQSVTYSGLAVSAIVQSGGTQIIDVGSSAPPGIGAKAIGTTVESGGTQIVKLGLEVTYNEASATILAGGTQIVSGYATDTLVLSGGTEYVVSGAIVSGTVISAGGTAVVSSGGSAVSATLDGSGALIDLQSGAIVTGGILLLTAGGRLEIDGTTSPNFTVFSFEPGDTFYLPNLAFDSAGTAVLGSGNVLHIIESGTAFDIQLDPSQDFSGNFFHLIDAGGATLVAEDTTPCFCRGTPILTDRGELAIETLSIGDPVVTLSGEARPIKWIGRRAYDARFAAGNRTILPIRIEAGALEEGVPARDLFVSPEHALYLDGLFLPARLLVNGATIQQVEKFDRLEYFHIELESHDVILAAGAAAETFVDFGGRGVFHNAAEFAGFYPDAEPEPWEPYAALLERGAACLPAVRTALLARAESLGRISRNPDLHLIVDGGVFGGAHPQLRRCGRRVPCDDRIAQRGSDGNRSGFARSPPPRRAARTHRVVRRRTPHRDRPGLSGAARRVS